MRILIVHPRMSIKGGGERVAIHSIAAALKENYEVYLLSEQFDKHDFEEFFGCDGLFDQVHSITYAPFRPMVWQKVLLYRGLFYHRRKMRRLLSRDGEFDLVLGTQDVAYIPYLKHAKTVQYCYFPEYFSHLEMSPSSRWWKLYYSPARRLYSERIGHIDQILSVSDFTRAFVRQKWARDSITVYPPCPVDFYSTSNKAREDVVVSVSRIVPEKRLNLFIEMARQLPRLKFVIVGSVARGKEDYYEGLKRQSPKNMSFTIAPLRKVKDILSRAKVYVHCAENEHFGISIVEAMAAGCVPVVHNSGGPREIVTADVGYRWNDIPEAVQYISLLAEDDTLRDKLSAAASARSQQFSSNAFETKLVHLLREFAGSRRVLE